MMSSTLPSEPPSARASVCIVKPVLDRAEVAQHPAGEVDGAASETWHLTAVDFGRVLSECREGSGPVPGQGLGMASEQQRVQRRGRVLHADLAPRSGAQQRERLADAALMRPQHAQPRRGGNAIGSLGQRHRLAKQQLGLRQIAGRVPRPAAHGQAASPRRGVRRREGAVGRELRGRGETAAEVGRPRADFKPSRPRWRGTLDVTQCRVVPAAAGADTGPREPGLRVGVQAERIVEQRFGRAMIEALCCASGCLPQRGGGKLEVAAQPGVPRDDHRIGVLPGREDAADLAVQQGRPARGGAGRERLSHQLVPKRQAPVLLDQELLGDRLFGVVEQLDERPPEHGRQQVDVELGADERGRAQRGARRAELVAARRDRVDERGGQLRSGRLLGELGQEERMAFRPGVQRIDATGADELRSGRPVEHVQMNERTAGQGLTLARPPGRDDRWP